MKQIDIFIINFFSAIDSAQAIANLGTNPLWDFWVVDNSNDETAWSDLKTAISDIRIPVHLIKSPKNIGFGNACNILFRKTHSNYCLLLNPDARIDAIALTALYTQLEANANFAALAPMMYWNKSDDWWIPTVTPQTVLHQIYQSLIALHPWLLKAAWQYYYKSQCRLLDHQGIVTQSFLSGAILLLRRLTIEQVNNNAKQLFDTRYFMFFEDADLSRRIRQNGYQLGIAMQVHASHLYRHSASKNQLMQDSFARYEACHEPAWLLRFKTWWLKRMGPYQQQVEPKPVDKRLSSLDLLNTTLGLRTLIAWSPVPSRMPAIWRKYTPEKTAAGFSSEAWKHLSQGHYYGVAKDKQGQLSWIEFDRH